MHKNLKRIAAFACVVSTLFIAIPIQAAAQLNPSDSLYSLQKHLQLIGMPKAWVKSTGNTKITIAVVDTGVDTTHPDLVGNLVKGYNVLDGSDDVEDSNGHGTNVAGVLAATGNNKQGVSGILWRAKIMPIKALDDSGRGDEYNLSEGIRYAVDHKAKIIVLSLGLVNYSNLLREAIKYAEQKEVLVVSAAGNEGNAIKYPAAFPTVLSVGGVNTNLQVNSKSNRGSELSLVAPWSVYTTTRDGKYQTNQGTSMAAPQVAGVAALVWGQHPQLSAAQVRAILTSSAQDLGAKGWDENSGFGLLRADLALAAKPNRDTFESNDKWRQAKRIPVDHQISATISKKDTSDWYKITNNYRGTIQLDLQALSANKSHFRISVYNASQKKSGSISYTSANAAKKRIPVAKGDTYLKVTYVAKPNLAVNYRLNAGFTIAADAYESNDEELTAAPLLAKSQRVTGTFSKLNDQDWYSIHFDYNAEIAMEVAADSNRMDLELMVQQDYEYPDIIDYEYEGDTEKLAKTAVHAGTTYFIRVRNVSDNDTAYPVKAQYTLTLHVRQHFTDNNEMNDSIEQATNSTFGKIYAGTFGKADEDYYKVKVKTPGFLTAQLANIPTNVHVTATLLTNNGDFVESKDIRAPKNTVVFGEKVTAGTYVIQLTSDRPFDEMRYKIKFTFNSLIAGYRDIAGIANKSAVIRLVKEKVLTPDADAYFYPNQVITRADAAAWVKAVLHKQKQAIVTVTKRNQNEPISRAQSAEIICKMLGWKGKFGILKPYDDVGYRYWAIKYIRQVKDKKMMGAVKPGKFYPEKPVTREAFAKYMVEVIDHQ